MKTDDAWQRIAEITNQMDMLEVAVASGALTAGAEYRAKRDLVRLRAELEALERRVGMRID